MAKLGIVFWVAFGALSKKSLGRNLGKIKWSSWDKSAREYYDCVKPYCYDCGATNLNSEISAKIIGKFEKFLS